MDNHRSLLCQKQGSGCPNGDPPTPQPPHRQKGSVQVEGRQSSIPKTKQRGLNTQGKARRKEPGQGNRSGEKRTNNKCEAKQNTQRKDGKNNRKCKLQGQTLTAVTAHPNWNHDALDRRLTERLSVRSATLNILTTSRASATLEPNFALWAEVRQVRWSPEWIG